MYDVVVYKSNTLGLSISLAYVSDGGSNMLPL